MGQTRSEGLQAHQGGTAPAGRGLTASALKTIAILAMLADHAAYVFLPDYWHFPALALHMLGRITGPVMFFFVAEGYHHTRDKNRYTLRMAAFAAISYLPFIWALWGKLAGNWLSLNVIYTLLVGLLALRAIHEVKTSVLRWALVALCFVASIPGDWSYYAVLYIIVFDAFRGRFRHQALGYAVVTLAQLLPPLAALVNGLLAGLPAATLWPQAAAVLYYAAFFIPLALLRFYGGQRGRGSKWLFYVFYPAHLLVIALVRDVLLPALAG